MSIIVSGSLVYDVIMDFKGSFKDHIMPESIHILNLAFAVETLKKSRGGTAGNIAYSIKLLGGEPVLVSAVGRDGGEYLEYFKKMGIKTNLILQEKNKYTATAHITTDTDDNQITAFYGGALAKTPLVLKPTKKARLLIISPTDKTVMLARLADGERLGIESFFDPGQQITSFSAAELKSAIAKSDFVIGNDYEIKLLKKKTGLTESQILARKTKVLITTLGKEGSRIQTKTGEIIKVGICKPKSIADPTGAGDAFRAGFCLGYERNFSLKTCAQLGATAAAYAIEVSGTQEHVFTLKEFTARYQQAFQDSLTL